MSWIDFHGRSAGLAEELGVEAVFLPDAIAKKRHVFKYLAAARFTRSVIRDRRPNSVIVMLPPAPLLVVAALSKPRGSKLIADLHTGFFSDPKWSWFSRIGLWMLRKNSAIVTNEPLAVQCRRAGAKAFVLHDILVDRRVGSVERGAGAYILCPLSYANDEPLDALIEATRRMPDLNFVFTGNAPAWVRQSAPENVSFPGFVSAEEYNRLVRDCLAVVAVTDRDHTMQRAGYEALMEGKPQVTAHFPVLRDFLECAAAYVDPSAPESIVRALMEISNDPQRFIAAANEVLPRRMSEQQHEIKMIREFLGS
ncbi:glycosyltransferase family protein [Rhodococcus sp. R1101]|uniref:glycosyltransferase family protein n=1 Tax=Rhodococcus sp. R1101 TaxID=1170698 RepID=UPI0012F6A6EA|nr:glycosyltransferase [Rhodococcus sp. R1101]